MSKEDFTGSPIGKIATAIGGGKVMSKDGSVGLTGHGTDTVPVKEGVNSATMGCNAVKSEVVKELSEVEHCASASFAVVDALVG